MLEMLIDFSMRFVNHPTKQFINNTLQYADRLYGPEVQGGQ